MVVALHVEDGADEEDEDADALAVGQQFVPELAGLVGGGGLVGIADEGELLEGS